MKKNFIAFLAVAIAMAILSGSASAQNVVYTDASVFPLYGKVSEQTNERYERLPSSLELHSSRGGAAGGLE